jgi:hypothetical protein
MPAAKAAYAEALTLKPGSVNATEKIRDSGERNTKEASSSHINNKPTERNWMQNTWQPSLSRQRFKAKNYETAQNRIL